MTRGFLWVGFLTFLASPAMALTFQPAPGGDADAAQYAGRDLRGVFSVSRQDAWGWNRDDVKARGGAGFGAAEPESDFGPNYPNFSHR